MELIIENEKVNNEIKSLIPTDKLVKNELFCPGGGGNRIG